MLENESIKIKDTTFLCCTLWTNFELHGDPRIAGHEATQKLTDFKKIRLSPSFRKLRSIDAASIHHRSVKWLKTEIEKLKGEKFVVVSHHAPSEKSLPNEFKKDILSSAYASNLEELVKTSNAKLWVHGHIHAQQDYLIGNTRVICNPRGYPDEPNHNFIQDLVVDI